MPSLDNIRVLVLEPANQAPPRDLARTNGSLGAAYLVGALRRRGIHADYLDGTVGREISGFREAFFDRTTLENGNMRYGLRDEILAEIISEYDVVATSSIFTLQTRMHFEAAGIAKKVAKQNGKEILVVSGGVNARALRELFLSNNFDIVALGEGEQTIVEIVEQQAKSNPNFAEINGIAFRRGGKTITNPVVQGKTSRKNLDYLPPPALDSFPLDIYNELGVARGGKFEEGLRYSSIQTSRGCQDKCTFCHISMEKKETDLVGNIGSLRGFLPERIAAEVDRAVDLGINRLYFEDDNLFYGKRRLAEIAPGLKRQGLTYSNINGANIRFLFRKTATGKFEVDTDFIDMLADFGLIELSLSFESSNLEIMNKYASGKFDLRNMDSVKVVEALRKSGIRGYGNFMIGFRDESWDSVVATKDFSKILMDAGLYGASFCVPVPYPGSLDFEMRDKVMRDNFERDPLFYCDRMQPHGKPLFPTAVAAEKLHSAVEEFWLEVNDQEHTSSRKRLDAA